MKGNNPIRKEENVNPRTQVKQTEGQQPKKAKPSEEREEKAHGMKQSEGQRPKTMKPSED